MSDNNWETQPRKDNGEFTFRYEFWKKKLEAMEAANANPEVSKNYDGGSYCELRKRQKQLIDANQFLAAQEMDFTNLLRKTKLKYVKAMLEKLEYDKKLYDDGVIDG